MLEVVKEVRYGQGFVLSLTLDGPHAGKTLPIHAYCPSGGASGRPVVIVMHGVTRAAPDYMESWLGLAERADFVLLVPEFSRADWPGSQRYNLGNLRRGDGSIRPREAWTFTIVERAFDAAAGFLGSTAERYRLYGHSAGAQFVHRFLTFTGGPRVERAVAANAGWYTLPDSDLAFPYGLGGVDVAEDTLASAFATELTILLGQEDSDPEARDLRRTPEALAQGPHRLARGHSYLAAARDRAAAIGAPFHWRVEEVPMIGHSDRGMAPFAARLLGGAAADATAA